MQPECEQLYQDALMSRYLRMGYTRFIAEQKTLRLLYAVKHKEYLEC